MATKLDIANRALAIIGQPTLTAFSESDRNIDNDVDAAVEIIVSMHGWNFAIKRAKLTKLDETSDQFFNVYALPGDFLKFIDLVNNSSNAIITSLRPMCY